MHRSPDTHTGRGPWPIAGTRLPLAWVVAWGLAAPALPASAAQTDAALSEIVVTATRRAQPRLDIAGSISRLEGGVLGRLDTAHAAEALNRVAGVLIQRGSGQESLTAIRSPVLTGPGSCGAFLMLEDGFPLRPVGFCNVNELFEVNTTQAQAIEVLRGPGTTVHGANAVHGVINVISPDVAELGPWRVSLGTGADDQILASFATAAPDESGGNGGSGAYGFWRHDGGFRADSPVSEGKLNLLHDRGLGAGSLRVRVSGSVLDQETAGFIRGLDAYRDPALRRSNPNPEAFRDAESARLSAAWSAEPCDGCSRELRLVLRHSSMEFLQHFLLGKPLERNAQRSVALAASTGQAWPGRPSLSWRAGADLEWAGTELLEIQDGPTLEGSAAARAIRPAGRHYDYRVDGRTVGAYGALDWQAGPRWRFAAALRAEQTRYDYDNRMRDGNTAEDGRPCGSGGCLYSRPADRTDGFDNLSPRLEASFAPTDSSRLYLVASRGFRPPEMTELYRLQRQQQVADLGSERLESLEAGWRHRGPRFGGSLAAFSMRKTGVILRDANGFNVGNGSTRHEGVEYELAWALADAWAATAAGSLARHRYDFSRVIEGGETITRGNDVDTAPRQLHSLSLDWRPRETLSASLGLRHVGAYFADAANLKRYPGHSVLDLRLAWSPGPRWRATLQLDNLADRAYADRADYAQGDWRYFPARGRTAFLTLEYTDRT